MVAVKDPLARTAEDPQRTPPLMIGSFLEISIAGREVQDVVRLDRSLLRKENTVWVYEEGVLRVRPVQIAFRDAGHVYIEAGLQAGEQVVVTDLSTAVDGSALRLRDEEASE
jgi:multidrug efflux pump subunit AcrA (membrane-fusion protein)